MARGYLQPDLVSIAKFFRDATLRVPEYQRAYAWEVEQWEDLWADVTEGNANGAEHFLGTVVLRRSEVSETDNLGRELEVYEIVDGQQRVTTLTLLLLAFYTELRESRDAEAIWLDFVECADVPRLRLAGVNADHLPAIVQSVRDSLPLPQAIRATNRRLNDGLRFFREKIRAWVEIHGPSSVLELAKYSRNRLQALRFVTDDASLAIKTFQTVNDRGKQLTLLDKAKSLLMYYVTKYLEGDSGTFAAVQSGFGKVYESLDRTLDLAHRHRVDYLTNARYRFGEGELLTFAYHYSCRALAAETHLDHTYAFDLSADGIFDSFIKPALLALKGRPDVLRRFVAGFVADFSVVAESLAALLERIPAHPGYEKLFVEQGVSASVYPLLIGLQARGMLDDRMLRAVAVLDLRVYKVRGTDPRAWLYKSAVSRLRSGETYDAIHATIVNFSHSYGSDSELDGSLRQSVYGRPFVRFVLSEMARDRSKGDMPPTPQTLAGCQVDHILPQKPLIDVTTCGFDSEEDYLAYVSRFGNLCLLEGSLNQGAGNVSLTAKSDYYRRSDLEPTRVMGHKLAAAGFRRGDIETRTQEIIDYFRAKWPVGVANDADIADDTNGMQDPGFVVGEP